MKLFKSPAMSCLLGPCGGDVTPVMFHKRPVYIIMASETRVNMQGEIQCPVSQACCDTVSPRGMNQGLRFGLQPSADAYQWSYVTLLTSRPVI